jgi:hypothetical protein
MNGRAGCVPLKASERQEDLPGHNRGTGREEGAPDTGSV